MSKRALSMIGALVAGAAFVTAHAGEAPAPSSVPESAPQKKEPPPAMKGKDSKDLPNPKGPPSVSESAPAKSADDDKKEARKKRAEPKPY